MGSFAIIQLYYTTFMTRQYDIITIDQLLDDQMTTINHTTCIRPTVRTNTEKLPT